MASFKTTLATSLSVSGATALANTTASALTVTGASTLGSTHLRTGNLTLAEGNLILLGATSVASFKTAHASSLTVSGTTTLAGATATTLTTSGTTKLAATSAASLDVSSLGSDAALKSRDNLCFFEDVGVEGFFAF